MKQISGAFSRSIVALGRWPVPFLVAGVMLAAVLVPPGDAILMRKHAHAEAIELRGAAALPVLLASPVPAAAFTDAVAGALQAAFLKLIADPQTWAIVAGLLYAVFMHYRGQYKAKIDRIIRGAYGLTEDAKARGLLPSGDAATTVEHALEHLTALADKENVKVTDELIDLAKLWWGAMHGYASSSEAAAGAAVAAGVAAAAGPQKPAA